MSEFKLVDDRQEPDEDSYETDPRLFCKLAELYNLKFQLDACAKDYNRKCLLYLTDAMHQEWLPGDVWCNPPHSLNEEFIRRADAQHKKYNINICMIVPANVQSSNVWSELIEDDYHNMVENHRIKGRPNFLKLGKKTKYPSRNAYRVIIWRKIES